MAAPVELIVVPYDSALRETRMGRGPNALLRAGAAERLAGQRTDVHVTEVEPESEFQAEIATSIELQRGVRRGVEAAVAAGRRPITLSGNCNTGVVGSLAAHGAEPVGLFWLDAHSDAETPETTTSGFLDGMGLAMAMRCCWAAKLDEVGCWTLPGQRTALVGAREISDAAGRLLREHGVAIVSPEEARAGSLDHALDQLGSAGARRVHLHVDLDVLDSQLVGPANSYALPDGVTQAQLIELVETILGRFELASGSVASYDPDCDRSGKVAAAGLEVISRMATA